MIEKQAKETQFICTTFRPEMLKVAQQFYGVKFVNKNSRISTISGEEAEKLMKLLEKDLNQGDR